MLVRALEIRRSVEVTFVQRPGDLVFVPDRWSHRTMNEKMTMGMTFEVASQRPMEPIHVDYVRPSMETSWRWCGVLMDKGVQQMGRDGTENEASTEESTLHTEGNKKIGN